MCIVVWKSLSRRIPDCARLHAVRHGMAGRAKLARMGPKIGRGGIRVTTKIHVRRAAVNRNWNEQRSGAHPAVFVPGPIRPVTRATAVDRARGGISEQEK
jgi:hypothetical protein